MQNKDNLTAAQLKYAEHDRKITELIEKLQAYRVDHARRFAGQPGNWGFVGDIGSAETKLAAAVEMLNPAWSGS